MKTIKNQLENIRRRLENELKKRQYVFFTHSEKWQESEQGESYREKIVDLNEVVSELDRTIDRFYTFLDI